MLWQLFLIVTIVWLLTVWSKNRGKREMTRKLKTDLHQLPLLGISHRFYGDDENRMNTIKAIGYDAINNGGLSSMWLGHRCFAIVAEPVDAEAVMKKCLEKDDVIKFLRILTGKGLVFAPVSIWRPRRKVLAPTFNQKNLNRFASIFAEQSATFVDRLDKVANKGTFAIWNYMSLYILDSVFEATLGSKLGAQKQRNHPFTKNFESFTDLSAQRITSPWLHNNLLYWFTPYYTSVTKNVKYINNFVNKIITNKKQEIKERVHQNAIDEDNNDTGKHIPKSFLELLIETSSGENGYTDLELREETVVLIVAGTDTSAVGSSFVSVMLTKHPDVQEKVYNELLEVIGDDDRPITTKDLPRLKYLDAVIKETLRLYPPVPVVVRRTEEEVILPSGAKLVPDVGVIVHIWAIHRNPRYWGNDAEVFRPERFFDSVLEHPAAYIPFSYGLRNCLGYQLAMMSMKTAIASLVRRYKLLPAEHILEDGDKPLRLKYGIIMKHVDNYQLKLVRRGAKTNEL